MMKKINFVTGNRNKLSEVQTILKDTVIVQGLAVDIPEIQGTIEEIAREKCRQAAERVNSSRRAF
jgi:inosine triphosphate pyrophosphatase